MSEEMSEQEKENTAVRVIIDEANSLCERLCPSDSNPRPHKYDTVQDQMHDQSKLIVLGVKMGMPIVKAFYNGGFPSKRAGKKVKFLGLHVPVEQLATIIMIGGMIAIIWLLLGGRVQLNQNGMVLDHVLREAAK